MKFVYERQVFYYETDQMGVVHHSNYLRWYEEARTFLLEQIGLPYDEMEEKGILIPVMEASSKYKKSFRFGDEFSVELSCPSFSGVKWTFEYVVKNKANGEVYNTGSSRHCFLNRDMKPFNLKKAYPELFDKMVDAVNKVIDGPEGGQ